MLKQRHGSTRVRCGPVELPLAEWYAYAKNNADESPLFVFDKTFSQRAPDLLDDYSVPRAAGLPNMPPQMAFARGCRPEPPPTPCKALETVRIAPAQVRRVTRTTTG